MTLPLFDDTDSRSPRRVTLVRLSGEIARSLVGIGRVAVEGEVHRPKVYPGGTWFTLRDRAAQIDVRVPGAAARRSRIVDGERVQVVATLQWANERGQLHLVAEEVLPVGAGPSPPSSPRPAPGWPGTACSSGLAGPSRSCPGWWAWSAGPRRPSARTSSR